MPRICRGIVALTLSVRKDLSRLSLVTLVLRILQRVICARYVGPIAPVPIQWVYSVFVLSASSSRSACW